MTFVTKNLTLSFLKKLANLSFAISLLFILGILIALGTIIEQDQNLDFYQTNYPTYKPLFNFLDWRFIQILGLDHIYSAYWFFFILFIFGCSLMACTFTTQLPSLKKFKLWNFISKPKRIEQFNTKTTVPRSITNSVLYQVHDLNYHIFRQERKNYAYVGLLGRLGPIAVHLSIILLLIGTSLGSLTAYNIQEIAPRGEIVHLQNVVKSGPLTNLSWDKYLRINDFWITYTKDAKVNQFYSDLSLLTNQGSEIERKVIFVNEPFQWRNLTIYQTDWDINGLKLKLNDSPTVQVPLQKINKSGRKFWLGSFSPSERDTKKLTFLITDLAGTINIYNEQGLLVKTLILGQNFEFDSGNYIKFTDFITSTGLQIKEDPGIAIVYLSFLFLMLSIYISFFSYSQIWGIENNANCFLGGKSNRAVLDFQEQFKRSFTNI